MRNIPLPSALAAHFLLFAVALGKLSSHELQRLWLFRLLIVHQFQFQFFRLLYFFLLFLARRSVGTFLRAPCFFQLAFRVCKRSATSFFAEGFHRLVPIVVSREYGQ